MEACRCTASWLPAELARAGGLGCTWCGLALMLDGKQLAMTAEVAETVAPFLRAGGEAVYLPALKKVLYIPSERVVAPPGRAHIEECPDCERGIRRGAPCDFCDGTGWQVWKACPRCGDTAMWRHLDDRTRMHCQACSATWGTDYPGWLAQRLPERLVARCPARSDLR